MTEYIKNCGHTAEDHIFIDDRDMIDRLIFGKYDIGKFDASNKGKDGVITKFTDEMTAERVIKALLKKKECEIVEWLKYASSKRLVLSGIFLKEIGYGIARGTDFKNHYPMYRLVVILEADCHYRSYSVITAYPKPNKQVAEQIMRDRNKFYNVRKEKKSRG